MEEKDILILEKEIETLTAEEKKIQNTPARKMEAENFSVSKRIIKRVKNSSSSIDKPNYDFIEPLTQDQRRKVYKIEKVSEKQPRAKLKKLRVAIYSIVLVVFVGWGIGNLINISSLNNQISTLNAQYQLNLTQYLTKLSTLDSTSQLDDLFPTYPSDINNPDSVDKTSNWFDRFCNFISELFGG